MTLLTLSIAAMTIASPSPDCSLSPGSLAERRVFTNADLERMAACRYQTGVQSKVGAAPPVELRRSRPAQRGVTLASHSPGREADAFEANWRAQWRSVDQRVRRLRREAHELRQEAGEAPRDPKKKPSGRRSAALLIGRAQSLEAEAKELEDEFQERARREGALPGWLRPKAK